MVDAGELDLIAGERAQDALVRREGKHRGPPMMASPRLPLPLADGAAPRSRVEGNAVTAISLVHVALATVGDDVAVLVDELPAPLAHPVDVHPVSHPVIGNHFLKLSLQKVVS